MEMIKKGKKEISSSMEWISLYIDLSKRKVIEFENEKLEIMDKFIKDNKSNFTSQNLQFTSKLKKII
jgi:acyl-CoA thioester hydrolase